MKPRKDISPLKTEYITSDISLRELVKKHKDVSLYMVSKACRDENWVQLRDEYRDKASAEAVQKIRENATSKTAENTKTIQDIAAKLLGMVKQATDELSFRELHNRRQVKRITDLGKGQKEEKTETKEYLERVECAIDMDRVQKIAFTLKEIIDINSMTSGDTEEISDAFEELMTAIGDSNEDN